MEVDTNMGQSEVIKTLEKAKKPLSAAQITKITGNSDENTSISKLRKRGEIKCVLADVSGKLLRYYFLPEKEGKISFKGINIATLDESVPEWLRDANWAISEQRNTKNTSARNNKGFPYRSGRK